MAKIRKIDIIDNIRASLKELGLKRAQKAKIVCRHHKDIVGVGCTRVYKKEYDSINDMYEVVKYPIESKFVSIDELVDINNSLTEILVEKGLL